MELAFTASEHLILHCSSGSQLHISLKIQLFKEGKTIFADVACKNPLSVF